MADMSVNLCGIKLKNPIVTASGTFGFGWEYKDYYDIQRLGAICVKGLTLQPREGNPPPRIAETSRGMLNSVGLQNPGVDAFLKGLLPWLRKLDVPVIANAAGFSVKEFASLCEKLSVDGVDMIELNISCPNVDHGGIAFGTSPEAVTEVVTEAKRHSKVPVIVKLSPNVTDITEIARAAEAAGADALSLINTLLGMRIDVRSRRPILRRNAGGLSGPAVLPVAVRMVWEVSRAVGIPIIGMGGVMTGENAAELMLAGASAVAVGTATVCDPYAPVKVLEGLRAYMEQAGVNSPAELTGAVKAWD